MSRLSSITMIGKGITGWAVEHREAVLTNEAHLDPRAEMVPGTPTEPEALITVPLISKGGVKGALNLYRIGETIGACLDPVAIPELVLEETNRVISADTGLTASLYLTPRGRQVPA